MLGRIHGSVEHFYVPNLVHQDLKVPVGTQVPDSRMLNLFKLGWDKVDEFKRKQYTKWIEDHWKEQFPAALQDRFPATLPPRYDEIINGLTFALSHDYLQEVHHFTQLYYAERHRVRKFDTVIRDMCGRVSVSAISCAFNLLSDCVYDIQNQKWLREHQEVDKRLIGCLLRYKFWREATGSGLVWEFAGFDELDQMATRLLEKGARHRDVALAGKYRRCLTELKTWETEQDKFRDFITLQAEAKPVPKLNPFYTSQEVHGEALAISATTVTGTLCRQPLPGTVVMEVLLKKECLLRVSFDAAGKTDVVLVSGDTPLDVWCEHCHMDYQTREVRVMLRGGRFPAGATAVVSYEYDIG